MAYHSHYNSDTGFKLCCGIPLVPLNPAGSESSFDPVEEAIELFRPNSLFKNFEFRGPGDKLLVYLIIFINSCLRRLAERKPGPPREEARQLLYAHAHDRFALPGQAGFPLSGLFTAPASREEEDSIRTYLRQCREEVGRRLLDRLYGPAAAAPGGSGAPASAAASCAAATPNKHWMAFANRRFLDRTM
ncbi:hypothetical protein CHLRE_09g397950v5 [Chlamydomonas reinhardtii]|uniref:Actin-related protein 2/3 complex subunit 3 n=1 Tax=Chlamydomonas reinhardtii TaxID=3055 RepID=A0A2K3DD16_CHLRE|nr:uncharacterized protein CHLRE_09g397950v5 [Chlamydomonas reinhardtii]PNW78426.1 hypothetical protein CHLRE_09g397950v5 [Chlamydomonas reinhardtii]